MSELKVNKITPRTGTTITLGDSGDSLSIASGVALTDFTSTGIDDNATSTALTIDSSQNVGIGTSSPSAKLEVEDGGTSNSVILKVTADDGGPYAFVVGNDTYSTSDVDGMTMYVNDAGVANLNVRGTGSQLAMRTVGSERMRIDSSGTVLVGKTSSNISTAGVELLSDRIYSTRDGSISLYLNRLTSDGTIAEFRKDNTTVGSIGSVTGFTGAYFGDNTVSLAFYNNNNLILPSGGSSLNKDGDISLGNAFNRFNHIFLGGNIYLGGTGSANALDDYEEGSWTPNYSTEGGGESITYDGITSGSYVKVGQLVLITGNIRTDGWSGGSSYVYLGGFPFTVNSDENAKSYIGFARANNFTGESPLNGECVNGGTKAFLKYRTSVSGDHQNTVVSDMNTGTDKNVIYFTGVYRTN